MGLPGWRTGTVTGHVFGFDPDRNPLTYSVSTPPAKGTAVIDAQGRLVYAPTEEARHAAARADATDADKTDLLVVTADDGRGGTRTFEMTVRVRPENERPVAVGSIGRPDKTTGTISGVVSALDSDGDALMYTVSETTKGTVVVNSDGTFVYTPTNAAEQGVWREPFRITVSDGHGGAEEVDFPPQNIRLERDVTITNTPPTVWSHTSAATRAGAVTGRVFGYDREGNPLTYSVSTMPAKGTVVMNTRGTLTYLPNAEARHAAARPDATEADKSDSFIVHVDDGNGGVRNLEVTVKIRSANSAPVAVGSVGSPDPATGQIRGVVSALDTDGDVLSYKVSETSRGSVVVAQDGSFTYTPTRVPVAGRGVVREPITVTVYDGHGGSDDVTFPVQYIPVRSIHLG